MQSYLQPKQNIHTEFVEKKSRFITDLAIVHSTDEALQHIKEIKNRYPDARHHCTAFRIHTPFQERYNDDGEPQGTAGPPILSVLSREELFNICVVVTRYFGGILLGASGLTRAYTRGAADAVSLAEKECVRAAVLLKMRFSYAYHDFLFHFLRNFIYTEKSKNFTHEVELELWVPAEDAQALRVGIREGSANNINVVEMERKLMPFRTE